MYSSLDFPGVTVFKDPPANARNMGSTPGLGRFHTLRGQLGPPATTAELTCSRAHALQQEKPPQGEALAHRNRRQPPRSNEGPAQAKIN